MTAIETPDAEVTPAIAEPEVEIPHAPVVFAPGLAVAVLGALGMGIATISLVAEMSSLQAHIDLSAVQITQVYTQHAFWLLLAIGVVVIGAAWSVAVRRA